MMTWCWHPSMLLNLAARLNEIKTEMTQSLEDQSLLKKPTILELLDCLFGKDTFLSDSFEFFFLLVLAFNCNFSTYR